jgi:RNA polymerase sigma factor (sigma-70 family)
VDKYTIGHFKIELDKNSKKLFEFIYKVYYPKINKYIKKNNGSEQDAKDVFQEGVLAVIRNVEDDKVNEKTPFDVYLYSVCRFIWLNHLRAPKFDTLNEKDGGEDYGLEEETISGIEDSVEKSIFQRNFKLLEDPCHTLLKLFFEKVPLKEIAKILGFRDEGYAKKRKHICKEKLVKMIKEDPEYKIFMRDKNV